MTFLWVALLAVVLVVPILVAIYLWSQRRRRPSAARYSSLSLIRAAMPGASRLRRHLPFALFAAGLAALVIALGRPVVVLSVPSNQATILLAMDVSGSMCSTDIDPTRLEAAEKAAVSFVTSQASGSEIGLVAFSGLAAVVQAPTTDQQALVDAIKSLTTGRRTAIGEGILASIDAIAEVDPNVAKATLPGRPGLPPDPVVKGAYVPDIVVLLTDGANNAGTPPLDAAQQAVDRGVRVYTIGFGTAAGGDLEANCRQQFIGREPAGAGGFGFGGGGGFGGGPGGFRRGIDEDTLRAVANLTGGAYYPAESASELEQVFRDLPTTTITKAEPVEVSAGFVGLGGLLAGFALLLGRAVAAVTVGFHRVIGMPSPRSPIGRVAAAMPTRQRWTERLLGAGAPLLSARHATQRHGPQRASTRKCCLAGINPEAVRRTAPGSGGDRGTGDQPDEERRRRETSTKPACESCPSVARIRDRPADAGDPADPEVPDHEPDAAEDQQRQGVVGRPAVEHRPEERKLNGAMVVAPAARRKSRILCRPRSSRDPRHPAGHTGANRLEAATVTPRIDEIRFVLAVSGHRGGTRMKGSSQCHAAWHHRVTIAGGPRRTRGAARDPGGDAPRRSAPSAGLDHPARAGGNGAFAAASRISRSAAPTPPVQASPWPGSSQAASIPSSRSSEASAVAGSSVNGAKRGPTSPVSTLRVVIPSPMNSAPTDGTWIATLPGVWPGSGITCGDPGRSSVASPSINVSSVTGFVRRPPFRRP